MQATLANDLSWSPSMVFSVECTSPNHTHTKKDIINVTAMGKEVKYSYYLHFFVHKDSNIKITICKGPLTLIEAKLMGLATKDINIPCMHAELRRLVCMALH